LREVPLSRLHPAILEVAKKKRSWQNFQVSVSRIHNSICGTAPNLKGQNIWFVSKEQLIRRLGLPFSYNHVETKPAVGTGSCQRFSGAFGRRIMVRAKSKATGEQFYVKFFAVMK
jgi:hypothetical protein